MNAPQRRVLVIKLGALGDFVQAMGPFAAIRAHHRDAHITLLTTRPYAELARRSPWFDAVWMDERPRVWRPDAILALRRRLREGKFERIYDLQTSDRSSWYFRLLGPEPRPEWSGIARGCSHPHANPRRDFLHTLERQAEQLRMAGIEAVPAPDLGWCAGEANEGISSPYVLLVPGGAPHRPDKRWPAAAYAELARQLHSGGITPVWVGTGRDRVAGGDGVDLFDRTSLFDIISLARRAAGAVGNDTGPMHLIAASGCASIVLYAHASDPALCGQRGAKVTIVRRPSLESLSADEVLGLVLAGVP
ncbi:MAG: glycosyltransferase family 9 protein [Alphaproteobacteria bacterium]|nr:glycosyltransferase family 9 protein [Alphaproteobacteria bacterium]